ncbi:MAG TPA: GlxA family transcriptional regulator [Bryobacteraceae bacterium]
MKRVVFAAIPPIQILDLTAPFEVFARTGGYRVEVVTNAVYGWVESSCGLAIGQVPHYETVAGDVDTLIVPGGDGAEALACDEAFLNWVRFVGARARRVGSICTGAFVLAAAGLLDGRRAVTHWGWCTRLAKEFPKVRVEQDPIYIRDGSIYTSAGITAGLDLALALVEEDHGPARALKVARDLVMFLRRPGGQSQFSSLLESQRAAAGRGVFGDLLPWLMANLKSDVSVARLARHCGMSGRHFARVFAAETGLTPARYVERIRVEAAGILLGNKGCPLKEAAAECGFGSADSMRRSFLRVLGVTPGEYAERFRG